MSKVYAVSFFGNELEQLKDVTRQFEELKQSMDEKQAIDTIQRNEQASAVVFADHWLDAVMDAAKLCNRDDEINHGQICAMYLTMKDVATELGWSSQRVNNYFVDRKAGKKPGFPLPVGEIGKYVWHARDVKHYKETTEYKKALKSRKKTSS
jgi:hypothetical protein